ncbi:MAG: hypothetical protein HC852_03155 [Acaryochloridaceae cyanobacterium RU_4_10]|nr:hypothetical protein [Acaryochloridaceae cyanobacterium RU_4_10]
MIEVCPRCYSRLGAPLKSGRLVCANCGWSNEPAASKTTISGPNRSPFVEILVQCWRIVKRTVTYVFQAVTQRVQEFRQVESKQLVKGLSSRLSALEQAIPTGSTDAPRWMTLEDAFRYLGGDPNDSHSAVSTVNGSSSLPFRRFRALKNPAEFRSFGLEADVTRRDANKPWLRWTDEG